MVGIICIVFAMAMTTSTLTGILFRYIMVNPITWTEEFSRYTMIWMGLLGISIGVKHETHLGINFFYEFFPKNVKLILRYLIKLMIGLFFIVMLIYGIKMSVNGLSQISPALKMKMFYILIAVPITSGISIFHIIYLIVRDIKKDFFPNGGE